MGEWSELPVDLLEKIDEQLESYLDKIRVRCVSRHWQSTPPKLPDHWKAQPPWLLMPYKRGTWCGLYSPFEKKVLDIDFPEAGEKVYKGSDHGWVVTTQQDGSISVVNPLWRILVLLPPRYKFADVIEFLHDELGKEYLFEYDGMVAPGAPMLPQAVSSMVIRNYKD